MALLTGTAPSQLLTAAPVPHVFTSRILTPGHEARKFWDSDLEMLYPAGHTVKVDPRKAVHTTALYRIIPRVYRQHVVILHSRERRLRVVPVRHGEQADTDLDKTAEGCWRLRVARALQKHGKGATNRTVVSTRLCSRLHQYDLIDLYMKGIAVTTKLASSSSIDATRYSPGIRSDIYPGAHCTSNVLIVGRPFPPQRCTHQNA